MSKSFKTTFQRSCRPTSGWTTPEDASSTPRWSRSWLTCAAWMKSTPSNIALCPSSLSIACSSPHWCLRCSAVRCHSKASVARSSTNVPSTLNNHPRPQQSYIFREDDFHNQRRCNFHVFICPSSSPHLEPQAPTQMSLDFFLIFRQSMCRKVLQH